jgi:peptidyl-tRNA hydrolase
MKMYILVRDDIPLGFAMVAVAHASFAGYLRFQDEPEVREWLSGPFFKAVCKVNAKEFENAKQVADHVVLTESALGDRGGRDRLQAAARMAEDVQVPEAVPRSTGV